MEPAYGSTVSVPIAWATFAGSTCLLFLLCYFCQKKLQEKESPTERSNRQTQQVYVISSVRRSSQTEGELHHPAPPDYESALYPKSLKIDAPPSYEIAIATKALSIY